MEIARYTCNASGVIPTFNSGYVYETNEVDNGDGTYTVTITSDNDFSSCSFNGKNSLLTVEYLKITNLVTNMKNMFNGCTNLTSLDLSNFNTSEVTDMSYIFYNCNKLTSLDLSSFNTSKVTDMSRMFGDCDNLTSLDLSSFNTSKVTDMSRMFYYCVNLTSLNLSNFNTNEVTTMEAMFYYCENLTSLDLSNFNTSEVTAMSNMFNGCSKLSFVNIFNCNLTTVTKITVNLPKKSSSNYGIIIISENIQTDSTIKENCKNKYWTIYTLLMIYTFNNNTDVLPTFNEEYTYDYINFDENNNDNTITRKIFVNKLPTSVNFKNCRGLISFNGLYATSIINMSEMFYDCNKLTSVDLSNIDVSKVTDMENIFYNCKSLTTLDIRNWIHNNVSQIGVNTLPVGDEEERKVICSDTFIAPEGWIVININERNEVIRFVTNKSGVLPTFTISEDGYTDYITEERYDTDVYIVSIFTNNLRNLPTDISFENLNSLLSVEKINISNEATNINRMFYGCASLTSVNLSSFNTENIVEMISTFENCNSLISLDLSSFNTNKVVDMKNIFKNCSSLTLLDLSNFNIGNETDIDGAFDNCTSLTNVGTLYCTENTIDKIKSVFAPAETCVFWVTDTKASDFTDTDKIIHKNYKHTVKNIYLPSSLKQNDRLYWDEETKEYLIEYSNGDIRETNIREQIDIKTYKPMYTIECSSNILANNIKVTAPFKIKSGDYDASKELEYLKQSFELRHPDADDVAEDWGFMGVGEEGTGLKALIDWVDGCSDEEFVSDFEQHFLKSYTLRYYCLVVLIGAVDNLGKNMMLDTSDNKIYFPRFYDIDTILSYDNSGDIKFDVDIEMEQGYWNTSSSRLWTRIRDLMHDDIVETYNDMRKNGVSYENIMKYMYEEQISKIPQTYYNKDYDVKYAPFGDSYMGMAHGDGYQHMKRWLKNRFIFCDTLFDYAPSYNNDVLTIRANTTELMNIQIETYTPVYQHVSWYNGQMDKKKIDGKSAIEFSGKAMAETDQEVLIYGGSNIKKITGISSMNPNQMLIGGATRLVELDASNSPLLADINSNKANLSPHTYLNKVNLSNCPLLGGNLRLNNSQLIQEVNIKGTAITGLNLPSSIRNLEILRLPSTITFLTLNDAGLLNTLEFDEGVNLQTINMINCNNLTNTINFDLTKALSISLDNSMTNHVELYFSKTTNLSISNMSNLERVIYTPNAEHEVFDKVNVDNAPNYTISTFNCPKLNEFVTTAPYRTSYGKEYGEVKPNEVFEANTMDISNTQFTDVKLLCTTDTNVLKLPQTVKNLIVDSAYDLDTEYLTNGDYDTIHTELYEPYNTDYEGEVLLNGEAPNLIPSASDGSIIQSVYVPSNTVQPSSGVWDLKGLELEEYHTFGLNNDVKLIDNTLTMPDRYDEYSLSIKNKQMVNEIARYTASDWNTFPTFNSEFTYTYDIIQLNDGVYEYSIMADNMDNLSTSISFSGKSNLLTVKYLNVDNVTNMYSMFRDCTNLTSLNVSNFDTSNVTNMAYMFRGCNNLTSLDVSNFDTKNVNDMEAMFFNCNNLTSLDVSNFDTSNVTNMRSMFNNCNNLTSLDVSNFNTSKVTSMNQMFWSCSKLTSLDVSNFDTKNVNDMEAMFFNCNNLTSLDISSFNTSEITNMKDMFNGCNNLTSLDISDFNTSEVTNMNAMFSDCNNLTSLDVSNFNTSKVTNMSSMFNNCNNLTSLDVSNFNTSEVTDMGYIFNGCTNLTSLDISNFDTKNVNDMGSIFTGCTSLQKLYIESWPLNDITQTGVSSLPIGDDEKNEIHANVRFVIPTGWTLKYNNPYDIAIYTSNEPDALPTFNTEYTGYSVEEIDNGNGTYTTYIRTNDLDIMPTQISFNNKTSLLSVEKLNTSQVTTMNSMFGTCSKLTSLDLSGWDTSNVTDMRQMFYYCTNLTSLNVSNFDTSEITNMRQMFYNCNKLTTIDVSSFDTSNVTDMRQMFYECNNLTSLDVSNFDTSNVTIMDKMFYGCSSLTSLDLSNFDISKIRDIGYMFYYCSNLKSLDLSDWDTSNVTNMDSMFNGCTKLTSLDLSSFDTSKVTNMSNMFSSCSSLTTLDVSGWSLNDTTQRAISTLPAGNGINNLIYASAYFVIPTGWTLKYNNPYDIAIYTCNKSGALPDFNSGYTGYSVEEIDNGNGTYTTYIRTNDLDIMPTRYSFVSKSSLLSVEKLNTSNVTDMSQMFYYCPNLTSLDSSSFNTSKVTNMENMFYNCTNLTSLDLSNWDTSQVTNMGSMFRECKNLTNLDLSDWDTSNVTSISYMFFNCTNLTSLDLSSFNTSKVATMSNMFNSCTKLTNLDLSDFDTSSVTTMSSMFNRCTNLTSLDLSNWDTSEVTNMSNMFNNCTNLTSLDLSDWDTSEVTTMSQMFYYCSNLTSLDLSSFNTSKVTNMNNMFNSCTKLTNLDLSDWDTSEVTNIDYMFSSCSSLTSLNVVGWSLNNTTQRAISTLPAGNGINNLIYASVYFTIPSGWTLKYNNPYDIAIYTYKVSGVLPTFNSEYTGYTTEETNNGDGTYTTHIRTNNLDVLPTKIDFNSKSNLLTVEKLNVDNVTNMNNMFNGCSNLTSLDLSEWDTSKVINMRDMFNGCSNLTSLDLSNFDTSKVTNMYSMFGGCKNLTTLDLSNFDTSKVTDMGYMFYGCSNLTTLDLSGWDISKVTNMASMFNVCSNLTSLNSMTNISVSLNLSNTKLDVSSLLDVIDNLATLTTKQTLTLGTTLLAKLTEEQIAVAVNKGWTVQ